MAFNDKFVLARVDDFKGGVILNCTPLAKEINRSHSPKYSGVIPVVLYDRRSSIYHARPETLKAQKSLWGTSAAGHSK